MINHDASFFDIRWALKKRYQVDAAEFTNDKGETLTVMNVNRTNIEHMLGVDLFYYHHRFSSYTMIQYKRMLPETKEVAYRPDKQFFEEIERMKKFEKQCLDTSQSLQPDDYRLNPDIFFSNYVQL
jgi:hypothetical protein